MKDYTVHKQGDNWVAIQYTKSGSYETQLPYYVKTKEDVKRYLSDEYEEVKIHFSK